MNRRRMVLLLCLATLTAAYVLLHDNYSLDDLVQREARLREAVEASPVAALVLGLIVYVAASLVPGTTGKAIVCGWVFGFWAGLIVVNLGLTIAAMLTFLAVRFLFADTIRARMGRVIGRIDRALERDGALYFVGLRLAHAPYTLTNYAAGATRVPTSTFWWTTQAGLLPGNMVLVLAGAQLPTLAEVTRSSWMELVNFPLLIAVSAIALLPVATHWVVRQRKRRSCSPTHRIEPSRKGGLSKPADTKHGPPARCG